MGQTFHFAKEKCFMLSCKMHHTSLTLFLKGARLTDCSSSGGFERQSRVIEFSVDECYIKDL